METQQTQAQPPNPGYPQDPYPAQPQPEPEPQPQQQQPQPQAPMTTKAGGNLNAKNMPRGTDGREWSNALYSCCDEPGTCVTACLCPCFVYAGNKQRLEHLEQNGTPDPEEGGEFFSKNCCVHATALMCFGAGWILQFLQRGYTRNRYNIRGGMFEDCCTSVCCTPCELTQQSQEIQLEEMSFIKSQ